MENETKSPVGVLASETASQVEISMSSPHASAITSPNPLRSKRASASSHEPSPRQRSQLAGNQSIATTGQSHGSTDSTTSRSAPSHGRQSHSHLHGHLHSPILLRPRAKDSGTSKSSPTAGTSSSTSDGKPVQSPNLSTLSTPSLPSRPLAATPPRQRSASPAKRSPKALPQSFFDCDIQDLLILISSMLSELIKLNDALPLVHSKLTRFHSRAPPLISHADYLHRLTRFCSLEKSTLLSMVFYIDLLCGAYSSFTINSLTVHRFLITAATVASKGLCDSFCTNAHYARVGGVSLTELNLLEVEFLVRVGWRVVPAVKTLDEYYKRMVARMGATYILEEQPKRPIQSEQESSERGYEAAMNDVG
ncbi:cyclin-domain-containing protein [Lipomyces kononenkoae]|uniref:Cyclin-domain-containing protein n=1 Tax=Lipomyces kononenkoae TaxID=34357 RepID=A0ACC3T3F4_LIPKO